MRRILSASLLAFALTACSTTYSNDEMARAADAAAAEAEAALEEVDATGERASLADLVAEVDIPYETFTLPNGLTTIVHTDRKSPVVGVTVYYRVGSKHEPRGRTGFAHLFEHLMFGGSENVPNFDVPLEAAGSTSTNGSTNFDRTNYVETVPTGALDLALFMESDRMGHLLGAVSQEKLDKQRGVVQNEKRQGDNQPYGLAFYAILEGLLPVGHPYRHSVIGSMADLDAASLADVRKWFIDNYGPNNVVLALAGDIDAATARPKVEKWFGHIPRGPEVVEMPGGPVTLAADKSREMFDQVPQPRIYRLWTGPDMMHADATPLGMGMAVLGGLSSSRLDTVLVREEELATSVSASSFQSEQLSIVFVQMDVKPGVDRAVAEARLDALLADYIADGPDAEELARAATSYVSSQIDALEQVGGFGGKGSTLAEGMLYTGNPAYYRTELERAATVRPAEVRTAMQRWLTRPVYKFAILPGERTEDGATMGGWGDEDTVPAPEPDAKLPAEPIEQGPPRAFPEVEPVGALTFPALERATLANGIPVTLARRTAIPKLVMDLRFKAGYAVDGAANAGIHSLMMEALEEGTTSRNALAIAEEQERLGASIQTYAGLDASGVRLTALTANLAPSLELMADIVRNPAFDDADISRLRDQRLAAISQQLASPGGIARRAFFPILYGENHPYGTVGSLGEPAIIEGVTPERLEKEHALWVRPNIAQITVVGDIAMDDLLAQLNAQFGGWDHDVLLAPRIDTYKPTALTGPGHRLVVIDRPNSPQSVILAGRILPLVGGSPDTEPLELANEVLGNGFLSRINLVIREEKGWSYGARSAISAPEGARALTVSTAVQSDRTADSIGLILQIMDDYASGKAPVNDEEFARVTDGNIRGLPNRFQTNAQVLGAILDMAERGRPDDYYTQLPATYRAITREQLSEAARSYLGAGELTIVVVGDRSQIDGQLETLDIKPTYVTVDTNVSKTE